MDNVRTVVIPIKDEPRNHFTPDYADEHDQRLEVEQENGIAVLYVNRQACGLLARMFAKLSVGDYSPGFHLDLDRNFKFDDGEVLRVVLVDD